MGIQAPNCSANEILTWEYSKDRNSSLGRSHVVAGQQTVGNGAEFALHRNALEECTETEMPQILLRFCRLARLAPICICRNCCHWEKTGACSAVRKRRKRERNIGHLGQHLCFGVDNGWDWGVSSVKYDGIRGKTHGTLSERKGICD